jgi:hypothetical protein
MFEALKAELFEGTRVKDRLQKAIKEEKARLIQNRLELYREQKKTNEIRRKIEKIKEIARGEWNSASIGSEHEM